MVNIKESDKNKQINKKRTERGKKKTKNRLSVQTW